MRVGELFGTVGAPVLLAVEVVVALAVADQVQRLRVSQGLEEEAMAAVILRAGGGGVRRGRHGVDVRVEKYAKCRARGAFSSSC